MNRCALLLVLAASACGPYSYVVKAEQTPLAGQTVLMIDSLIFQHAEIDGLPESTWIEGQNATWKAEWGPDQARASKNLAYQLKARLEPAGITLTPQGNPQGATLLIKPEVTKLATGGLRATRLSVNVKLVDTTKNNAVLEEISTDVKVGYMTRFEDRLEKAAELVAENVALWVKNRAGK